MKNVPMLMVFVLAAGCAGDGRNLVPGQSTAKEVEESMGRAAEKRSGSGGETVYYYPQLPWGYASYAARIGADGRLVAVEQRLTLENINRLKAGVSRRDEVRDLLGPPYEPMKQALSGNEIWTYPMRVPGHPTPKWFLVTLAPDGVVSEAYLIDDPNYNRHGVRTAP